MDERETIRRLMQDVPPRDAEGTSTVTFDLELFRSLNQEYADRPVLQAPRALDEAERSAYGEQRVALLERRLGLRGKRILEVGCGAGDVSRALAGRGREVVGVDVSTYPTWDRAPRNVRFLAGDLSEPAFAAEVRALGPFDRIVSLVVWEHVAHPYGLLAACRSLLAPLGKFYLRANLYRSALASHLYRHVYFPWPHLLFPEQVFVEYFAELGLPEERPAWLNKLTYAQYLLYFDQLGFDVQRTWLHKRPLDEGFYRRFERQLSAYPRFDLTLDFFDVVLRPRAPGLRGLAERVAQRTEVLAEDAFTAAAWKWNSIRGRGSRDR